jgi:hypothetical protein
MIPVSFFVLKGMESVVDSLLTRMSNSIWKDEKLCIEKYLKQKWIIRNGQDVEKNGNYEMPVIFLVVEKRQKKMLTFGPATILIPIFNRERKRQSNKGGFVFFVHVK